jgi:2-iminobutanoate/2-iminopropanoate deaminase
MTVRSAISGKPPVDNLMKSLYYVVKVFYHIRVRGKGAVKGSGEKEGLGPLGQTLLLAPIRSHPTSRKRRKGKVVEQRVINPWTWQDEFGYVQAQEVSSAQRTLFCAGQTSVDADGRTVHPESMSAQITQAMDNLETVLRQAGAELSDVVRLNYYTTDVDGFFEAYDAVITRLSGAGCSPASTLLGVARLAFPELLVEIEATAVT